MTMTTDNDDIRTTAATIDFGMEVEAFLQSRIGRYLVRRAEDEVDCAVESFKHVSPVDSEYIRELQSRIQRAESFGYWLAEAIQEGINAQREFVERTD